MDRSSIQRALKTLRDMDLIKRKSMSLKHYSKIKKLDSTSKRGYLYAYNAMDIDTIKERMSNLLDKWQKSMQNYIDDLDCLFDCYEEDGKLC
jgi:predicted transcriptional regulator